MEQQVTPKEKILKKVRQALKNKSKSLYLNIDLDTNVFKQAPDGEKMLETFAKAFTLQNGEFIFCDNRFDFIDKLLTLLEQKKWKHFFCWERQLQDMLKDTGINFTYKKDNLEKIQASITGCEALISRTGTVLISSQRNSRTLTIWPHAHLVVAYKSQLVMELKDGLQLVRNRYGKNSPSMLNFISGPSRSSNIENTMTIGAHGPVEFFVFLIDDVMKSD